MVGREVGGGVGEVREVVAVGGFGGGAVVVVGGFGGGALLVFGGGVGVDVEGGGVVVPVDFGVGGGACPEGFTTGRAPPSLSRAVKKTGGSSPSSIGRTLK